MPYNSAGLVYDQRISQFYWPVLVTDAAQAISLELQELFNVGCVKMYLTRQLINGCFLIISGTIATSEVEVRWASIGPARACPSLARGTCPRRHQPRTIRHQLIRHLSRRSGSRRSGRPTPHYRPISRSESILGQVIPN